ncbi:MAG TPA: hypothetical protein PKE55_01240 [Kiritimatiellia bacterium]|nr:hypothetical protein [Kiritimatiellia bacterium]
MNWKRAIWFFGSLAVIGMLSAGFVTHRGYRLYETAVDFQKHINYLIENGESMAGIPASRAFSPVFLQGMFGDDPVLNEQLNTALQRAMREDPSLRQGEIAAMLVTYRKNGDDQAQDVVVQIFGDFPLTGHRVSMHRDGFFSSQIDRNLWDTGNTMISLLGRDLLVIGANEDVQRRQNDLNEAILSGDILPLAEVLAEAAMHYVLVFPAPRDILPHRMRAHVSVLIAKGFLSPNQAQHELTVLSPNARSASHMTTMMYDLRTAMILALRSRFHGVVNETAWGPHIPVWWAYEMAETLERTSVQREDNVVTLQAGYERVMVNATLKSIERFGRDLTHIRGVKQERLDPRIVDERMRSRSPLHYWSDAHKWGPNWPIAAPRSEEDIMLDQEPVDLPPVTLPL